MTIRFYKGDQTGEGQTVAALAVQGSPYCLVSALLVGRQAAGMTDGPLFRRISTAVQSETRR